MCMTLLKIILNIYTPLKKRQLHLLSLFLINPPFSITKLDCVNYLYVIYTGVDTLIYVKMMIRQVNLRM